MGTIERGIAAADFMHRIAVAPPRSTACMQQNTLCSIRPWVLVHTDTCRPVSPSAPEMPPVCCAGHRRIDSLLSILTQYGRKQGNGGTRTLGI